MEKQRLGRSWTSSVRYNEELIHLLFDPLYWHCTPLYISDEIETARVFVRRNGPLAGGSFDYIRMCLSI